MLSRVASKALAPVVTPLFATLSQIIDFTYTDTFTLMLKESEPSTTHITSTTGSAGGGGGKSSQLHDPLTEMASSFAFVTIATFAVISMLENIFKVGFPVIKLWVA